MFIYIKILLLLLLYYYYLIIIIKIYKCLTRKWARTHSTQIISLHSSQGDYTSLLEDLGEGAIRFQNLLIFFWIFDKGFVFK